MNSAICTLFEKHFHFGLAGLTNSLFKNGFRGSVYAGYRGDFPYWASEAKDNPDLQWPGARTLDVADGLQIHFLPVHTTYHLTNYKPNFMLQLLEGPAKNADIMAYFDPDIVLKCKWAFYERWISHGVAMVHEIRANDMTINHPIRMDWHDIVLKSGKQVRHNLTSYINGGFCGIARKNFEFIQVWKDIMDTGIKYYNLAPDKFMPTDRTDPFFATDQDALNMAAMCCECPISEIGPEGMDFIHGGWTMSHAVGSPKPWKKAFISAAFKGNGPSLADREFWNYVNGPIIFYNNFNIKVKRISMMIASFVCRFYKKN